MRSFKLRNGGLVVGEFQKLLAGQPSRRVGGMIGRGPDLAHQVEHVGRQPHVEQIGLIDLAGRGPGRRLVQHAGQAVQMLHENRNGNRVHGNRHGKRPLIVTMGSASLA
jgi:hypothetical protein